MDAGPFPTKLAILSLIMTILSTFGPGYHFAVFNIPLSIIQDFVNETTFDNYNHVLSSVNLSSLVSFTVNVLFLGLIAGSLLVAVLCEKLGRKLTLFVVSNVLSIVGSGCMAGGLITSRLEPFIIGRFLVGISFALSMTVLPMLTTEISPPRWLGLLGSFQNLFFAGSMLVAVIPSFPQFFGGTIEGLIILAVIPIVPSFIQLLCTLLYAESPKFLMIHRNNPQAAIKALKFYQGSNVDTQLFMAEVSEEKQLTNQYSLLQTIRNKNFRFLIVAMPILINGLIVGSGVNCFTAFSEVLFRELSLTGYVATTVITIANIIGTAIGIPLINRINRRPMMLIPSLVVFGLNILFAATFILHNHFGFKWMAWLSLVAAVLQGAVFNVGPFTIYLFLVSEMSPQEVRSLACTVTTTVNSLLILITNQIFYPLEHLIGMWSFVIIFIAPYPIILYLARSWLPETRNMLIQDIVKQWWDDSVVDVKSKDCSDEEGSVRAEKYSEWSPLTKTKQKDVEGVITDYTPLNGQVGGTI